MGNTPSSHSASSSSDDFFLSITDDILTNDTSIDVIIRQHPELQNILDSSVSSSDAKQAKSSMEIPQKWKHLGQLFSENSTDSNPCTSTSSSTSSNSSSDSNVAMTPLCVQQTLSTKKRNCLLLRIHAAYDRYLKSYMRDDGEVRVDDLSDVVTSNDKTSSDSFLFEASFLMTLDILKALGPSNDMLFQSLTGRLLSTIHQWLPKPVVLAPSHDSNFLNNQLCFVCRDPDKQQAGAIERILSFAYDLFNDASVNSDQKSAAFAIIFACSVAACSFSSLLAVLKIWHINNVHVGTEHGDKLLKPFIDYLYDLPTPIVPITFPTTEPQFSPRVECLSGGLSKHASIATDSAYLYVWISSACHLYKIGTGLHRTVAGNLYADVKDAFISVVDQWDLGEDIDDDILGSIACLNEKIYVAHNALGDNRLGVYDCHSLVPADEPIRLKIPPILENNTLEVTSLTSDGLHLIMLFVAIDLDDCLIMNACAYNPTIRITEGSVIPVHSVSLAVCSIPDTLCRSLVSHLKNSEVISFVSNASSLVIGYSTMLSSIDCTYYLQFDVSLGTFLGASCAQNPFENRSALCFDRGNNWLWGLDTKISKFNWWAQVHRPHSHTHYTAEVSAFEDDHVGISLNNLRRLQVLQWESQRSSSCLVQKAYILCILEKQISSYAPTFLSSARPEQGNEIQISYDKFRDKCQTPGRFLIRGQIFGNCASGCNFAILSERDDPLEFHNFDLQSYKKEEELQRMIKMLDDLIVGVRVLCLLVNVDSRDLNQEAEIALWSVGARNLNELHRISVFAMIGRKCDHHNQRQYLQSMCKEAKFVEVKCKVPSYGCSHWYFDKEADSIHCLVQLVAEHSNIVFDRCGSQQVRGCNDAIVDNEIEYHLHILASTMSLLSTCLYQLLQEKSFAFAGQVVTASDTAEISRIVHHFVSNPPNCAGSDILANFAVRLYVTALDLLLPSVNEKFEAMCSYFSRVHDEQSLTIWEENIFEHLTQELSSLHSVMTLFWKKSPNIHVNSNTYNGRFFDPENAINILSRLLNYSVQNAILQCSHLEKKYEILSGKNFKDCDISPISDAKASSGFTKYRNVKHTMDFALVLLSNMIKICLSHFCNCIISPEKEKLYVRDIDDKSMSTSLLLLFKNVLGSCTSIIRGVNTSSAKTGLTMEATDILDKSVVRQVLPTVLSVMSLLFCRYGPKVATFIKSDHIYDIQDCLTAVQSACEAYWVSNDCRATQVPKNMTNDANLPSIASTIRTWNTCPSPLPIADEMLPKDTLRESNWLDQLQYLLVESGSHAARIMIRSTPLVKEHENQNAKWLQSELMAAGCMPSKEKMSLTDLSEYQFLLGFADRDENTAASLFCDMMRRNVREDQGHVEYINRAVYLSCAALIKHHGLVKEAIALAEACSSSPDCHLNVKPSQNLLKVWQEGQVLRSFFGHGKENTDAELYDDDALLPPPLMLRGSSVFSEDKDTARVREMTDHVSNRARFLLCLRAGGRKSFYVETMANTWHDKCATPPISPQRHQPATCQWQAIKTEILSDNNDKRGELSGVDCPNNVTTSSKISSDVLDFLQDRTDLESLRNVWGIRDARAKLRSQGFEMMTQLLKSAKGSSAVNTVLRMCFRGMRKESKSQGVDAVLAPRDKHRVHYLKSVDGCNLTETLSLHNSFRCFLKQVIFVMMNASSEIGSYTSHAIASVVTVCNCLSVLNIDYDVNDHAMLREIGLIDALHGLLSSSSNDETTVHLKVWSLVEHLSTRFLNFDGQAVDLIHRGAETSVLTREIMALLIYELQAVTSTPICAVNTSDCGRCDTVKTQDGDEDRKCSILPPEGGTIVLSRPVTLHRDEFGHSVPDMGLGHEYSMSFWIQRKRSPIDLVHERVLGPIAMPLSSESMKFFKHFLEGLRVRPGPDMDKGAGLSDNTVGVITEYLPDSHIATVKFEHMDSRKFKLGTVCDGKRIFEVVLVDPNLEGVIFNHGTNSFVDGHAGECIDIYIAEPAYRSGQTVHSMLLTSDACLRTRIRSAEGQSQDLDWSVRIPPDIWTHVGICVNTSSIELFVNGASNGVQSPSFQSKSRDNSLMLFYIGQPPGYLSATVPSFTGAVSGIIVFANKFLTADNMSHLSSPSSRDNFINPGEDIPPFCIRQLEVLNTLYTNARAFAGFSSAIIQMSIVGARVVAPLFRLLALGSITLQASALRVLMSLLPNYSSGDVNEQAERIGLISDGNFVLYAFRKAGDMFNLVSETPERQKLQAKPHHEAAMAVSFGYMQLLRVLVLSPMWAKDVSSSVAVIILKHYPKVLNYLTFPGENESHDLNMTESVNCVLGLLGLCNDPVSGLYSGSRAKCLTISDAIGTNDQSLSGGGGIVEECVILGPTWPPNPNDASQQSVDFSNFEKEKWIACHLFGDAFYVTISTQPHEPVLLPRSQIMSSNAAVALGVVDSEKWSMDEFMRNHSVQILDMCESLSRLPCSYQLRTDNAQSDGRTVTKTVELSLPSISSCDRYKPTLVCFPNANHLVVSLSTTLPPQFTLQFSQNGSPEVHQLGTGVQKCLKLQGGVVSVSPVRISSEASPERKVELCVTAHFVSDILDRDFPTLPSALAINIKMRCLQTLQFSLKRASWLSHRVISRPSLLSLLVDESLVRTDYSRRKSYNDNIVPPVVLESDHPYQNNTSEYYPVKFPGAIMLKIIFDDQSQTEDSADFLTFYKSVARDEYWGHHKYSGVQCGNWPGTPQHLKPLVIPADSFVLFWKTDSSVTDWGWKLTVTPIFQVDSCSGSAMYFSSWDRKVLESDSKSLCDRSTCCQQLLRDGVAPLFQSPVAVDGRTFEIPAQSQRCEDESCYSLANTKNQLISEITHMQDIGSVVREGTKKSCDECQSGQTSLTNLTPLIVPGESVLMARATGFSLHNISAQSNIKQTQPSVHPMYSVENIQNADDMQSSRKEACGKPKQQQPYQEQTELILMNKCSISAVASIAMDLKVQINSRLAQDCLHAVLAVINMGGPESGCEKHDHSIGSLFETIQHFIALLTVIFARENSNDQSIPLRTSANAQNSLDLLKHLTLKNLNQVMHTDVSCRLYGLKSVLFGDMLNFAVGQFDLLTKVHVLPPVLGHITTISMNSVVKNGACDEVLKCNAGHNMMSIAPFTIPPQYLRRGSSFYAKCDICDKKKLHTTGITSYHCEICQYDCCGNCGDALRATARLTSSSLVFDPKAMPQQSLTTSQVDGSPIFSTGHTPSSTFFSGQASNNTAGVPNQFSLGAGSNSATRKKVVALRKFKNKKKLSSGVSNTISQPLEFQGSSEDRKVEHDNAEVVARSEFEVEKELWDVYWPDAKYLHLSFDCSSSIDESSGYVTISPYPVEGSNSMEAPKDGTPQTDLPRYCGAHWPGQGDVPALIVQGSRCIVRFHKRDCDSTSEDGVKADAEVTLKKDQESKQSSSKPTFLLHVYGVVKEPSLEEHQYHDMEVASSRTACPELACWVLEVLASCSNDHDCVSQLVSAATLKSLALYVTSLGSEKLRNTPSLPLIMNLFDIASSLDLSNELMTDLRHLGNCVIDKITAEQSTAGNFSAQGVPQHLQSLVHCAIVLVARLTEMKSTKADEVQLIQPGTCDASLTPNSPVSRTSSNNACGGVYHLVDVTNLRYLDPVSAIEIGVMFANEPGVRWLNNYIENVEVFPCMCHSAVQDGHKTVIGNIGYYGSGTHVFHVKLGMADSSDKATHPAVGCMLACGVSDLSKFQLGKRSPVTDEAAFSFGWVNNELSVLGGDTATTVLFGPPCVAGDIISIHVDLDAWTVSIARNLFMIGLALGPTGSGAAIEFDLRVLQAPLHPAVSLHDSTLVHLIDVFLPPPLYGVKFPLNIKLPAWLSSLQEVVKLLQKFDTEPRGSMEGWKIDKTGSSDQERFLFEENSKIDIEIRQESNSCKSDKAKPMTRYVQLNDLAKTSRIVFDHSTCLRNDDQVVIKRLSINDAGEEYSEVVFACVGMQGPQCMDRGPLVNSRGDIVQISKPRLAGAANTAGLGWMYHCGADESTNASFNCQKCSPECSPCYSCQDLRDSKNGKLSCPKGHVMITIPRDSAHPWNDSEHILCSNCYTPTSVIPLETFFCMDCEYDLCYSCGEHQQTLSVDNSNSKSTSDDVKFTAIGMCPQGHTLSIVRPGENRSRPCGGCDISHDSIDCIERFYCCRFCNFDLCTNCIQERQSGLGIKVGDTVARGAQWKPSGSSVTKDGMEGGLGRVVGFDKWFDVPNAGVRVQWTDCTSLHRWNYNGASDVIVLSQRLQRSSTIVLPGNKFVIEYIPGIQMTTMRDKCGIKCKIIPSLSLASLRRHSAMPPRSRSDSASFGTTAPQRSRSSFGYGNSKLKYDYALVDYINHVSSNSMIDTLHGSWVAISPNEEALQAHPVLKSMIAESGDEGSVGGLSTPSSATKSNDVASADNSRVNKPKLVEVRYELLRKLNCGLLSTVKYFDLCAISAPRSFARLLCSRRKLIFETVKNRIFSESLQATENSGGGQFSIEISRPRASRFASTKKVDYNGRFMIFSQVFRQVQHRPCTVLRHGGQLWNAKFLGERSQDVGGPYSESISMMMLELQSSSLPLLIRTPNGTHAVGQNRERWLFNPGATSLLHMEMYCFLGKLMGIAIRSKNYLAINLPSIIWKLLVQDAPLMEDLEEIDLHQFQSLHDMRNIHCKGIDRNSFSDIFYETFTTMSSDQREVELISGGSDISVTFDNRLERCDLVENYRLHEFDNQAREVRKGLGSVVPHHLLTLFTWDQLEVMVCGRITMDLALLKSMTSYSSCLESDDHIKFFWQVMEGFSDDERSTFLRFVWGRSRLPLDKKGFREQRFRIQQFNRVPADQYMPVAHTCFFSLELPRYSSLEITRDRLRYAIVNCQAIDVDASQGHDSTAHWLEDDMEDAGQINVGSPDASDSSDESVDFG